MRRRLTAAAIALVALVTLAFALPLGAVVRTVARDRALAGAERDLAALAPTLALTEDPDLVRSAIERTTTGAGGRLAVWLPDGTRVGDDSPVDEASLTLARRRARSFSTPLDSGVAVFTPVVTGDGDVAVLRARVPGEILDDGVGQAWAVLAAVALGLIAGGALIADRVAATVTQPSRRLARTARALAAGDLDARAAVAGPPEISDVAVAVNLLADRIHELLEAERERVADLSHRIRTPLTALRLDAESIGDPDLVADVDRLEEGIDEVIRAARRPLADRLRAEPGRCDVAAIAAERSQFWGALAEDQGRPWAVHVEGVRHWAAVPAEDMAAALDVLIGNVFTHTVEGTAYSVHVDGDEDRVTVTVDDAGPGIAGTEAMVRGVSGGGSTGLGLDIARRIADAGGGTLTIADAPIGGARVILTLAAAPSGPDPA